MQRLVLVLVAVSACKKEASAPAAQPVAGSAVAPLAATAGAGSSSLVTDASVHVADAAAVSLVELLRAVPATVRVSSQVRNAKILPAHLVDRDRNTAWNSRTGELVGAWISVSVPGARIAELRLTVGHTGRGSKGEDYFTMNPRIAEIRVMPAGRPARLVALDPEVRELQVVPVDADGEVRIIVTKIVEGSRKNWREIAVSELEAWGTPPVGHVAPAAPRTPEIAVGLPVADDPDADPCGDLDARKAEREAARKAEEARCNQLPTQAERDQCNVDPPGDPDCSRRPLAIDKLVPPWEGASVSCELYDDVYGPNDCTLFVDSTGGMATAASASLSSPRAELKVNQAGTADVIAGAPPELVLRYQEGEEAETEKLVICRALPKPVCADPIALAGSGWTVSFTVKAGAVVLTASSGAPPPDAIGTRSLVFPSP